MNMKPNEKPRRANPGGVIHFGSIERPAKRRPFGLLINIDPMTVRIGFAGHEFYRNIPVNLLRVDRGSRQELDFLCEEHRGEFGDRDPLAVFRCGAKDVIRLVVPDAGQREGQRVIMGMHERRFVIPVAVGDNGGELLITRVPMETPAFDRGRRMRLTLIGACADYLSGLRLAGHGDGD